MGSFGKWQFGAWRARGRARPANSHGRAGAVLRSGSAAEWQVEGNENGFVWYGAVCAGWLARGGGGGGARWRRWGFVLPYLTYNLRAVGDLGRIACKWLRGWGNGGKMFE